jgi:GNAT superfamily N-acetyltransferase
MFEIRMARPDDLEALYEVSLRTGDAGSDATGLFDDPRLLGEVYVGPYVMLDSGIGLTTVDDRGPGGYGLAAVDTRRFEAEAEEVWWPPLRRRHPDPGPDPRTADDEVIAVIHRPELAAEEVVARYPAHLHLDLLPRFQGRGLGRVMMQRLLDQLVECGVRGVHLTADARNRRAISFYTHLGFTTLDTRDDVVMGRSI